MQDAAMKSESERKKMFINEMSYTVAPQCTAGVHNSNPAADHFCYVHVQKFCILHQKVKKQAKLAIFWASGFISDILNTLDEHTLG